LGVGKVWQRVKIEQRRSKIALARQQISARRTITAPVDAYNSACSATNRDMNIKTAEVALTLFQRRNCKQRGTFVHSLIVVFISHEEEKFVSILIEVGPGKNHRTTNIAARIVVLA